MAYLLKKIFYAFVSSLVFSVLASLIVAIWNREMDVFYGCLDFLPFMLFFYLLFGVPLSLIIDGVTRMVKFNFRRTRLIFKVIFYALAGLVPLYTYDWWNDDLSLTVFFASLPQNILLGSTAALTFYIVELIMEKKIIVKNHTG